MKIRNREKTESLRFDDISYFRYTDREEEHGRGEAVITEGRSRRIIRDYPHICRVFRLGEGVRRYFGRGPFYAEEKLDGYNIRIVRHRGRLLAVTRGGIICPFTTEWAEFWRAGYRFDEFFNERPMASLCAEIMGDSPYNSKRYEFVPPGLSFFCFDIMNSDGTFLPVEEKYSVFSRLGFPCVPRLGRFTADDMDSLRSIVLDLNSRGREGLVLKSPESGRAIKFVTAESDLADLELFMMYYYDIEPGFYSSRILRVTLFAQEFGLDQGEYAGRLGSAIMTGYGGLRDYEGSFEKFTVYAHSPRSWELIKRVILKHADIVDEEPSPENVNGVPLYRILFRRKHRKSSQRFREIITGHEE